MRNKLKKGFSLIEVIISITLFSIVFSFITFGVTSYFKMIKKQKERLYLEIENTNKSIDEIFPKEKN
ncbi:MAG: hypothetical protein A2086_15595 [Spirochaetes bacterium GWD1_27_9]|nr:MAG: hypothetical protein A2Z98_14245 [Spirochaetes bacterium GWB1_27_13]OHD22495.1 MAG: hypothetical protein A2Y34_06750 [Spirochaetes bacterium GWC1_27_15]OHD42805.1 MAG: hypothetical protein A2086_15595 [Spirochaetes bacterium GWD1_27_9]